MKKILLIGLLLCSYSFAETEEVEKKDTEKKDVIKKEFTLEEKQILIDGEISTTRYVAGGVIGSYIGLGIGHGIVGKYSESGWRFTTGQLVSASLIVAGLSECVGSWVKDEDCSGNTALVLGVYGYIGFRLWEIYDIWTIVPRHNKRFKELKEQEDKIGFVPLISNDKIGAFLTYRF